MDHEWFKIVGQRLKEIEAQNLQRYRANGVDPELHAHPDLMGSRFWHTTDSSVHPRRFDYRPALFPKKYLKYIRNADADTVNLLAQRPYIHENGENTGLENTKTLVARLVMLNLEHLLPSD